VPYTFGVARFGGRNFTVFSGLLLLVPTVLAAFVLRPGTSYTTFVLVAAVAGVGGGNFASSMSNVNAFFPTARKGLALGLNAGGGNIGVAVAQLVGLLTIAVTGAMHPRLLLAVYIPLIVVASLCAALFMDNLATVRGDTGAARDAVREGHTWIMSLLYLGTFGSFIGYSFAFGLVLQNQFGRTPLQAAAVTFIGPLLGSLVRPLGGWLSDRVGGARVTFWTYLAMGVATLVCAAASGSPSLPLFTTGFIALFVLSGIGNGSTYKMIPSIFRAKALAAIDAGADSGAAFAQARRLSGAAIGLIAAVGALGGVLINLAFRQAFAAVGSGAPAFGAFLAFYLVCATTTRAAYLRRGRVPADEPRPAMAQAGG
jgi:NNP family nitrate/nitrite transporter-like MFS transporter